MATPETTVVSSFLREAATMPANPPKDAIKTSNMVSLIIENNGIPFDGEIDSIFNWGYHTGKGSGIGMFSAYEYINKYGGNIIAESTPNSEFTIRFIIKLPIYGKV